MCSGTLPPTIISIIVKNNQPNQWELSKQGESLILGERKGKYSIKYPPFLGIVDHPSSALDRTASSPSSAFTEELNRFRWKEKQMW